MAGRAYAPSLFDRYIRRVPWYVWAAAALALALLAPIGALFWLAANPQDNIWPHLWRSVLPGQINTTLYLMGGVAFVTATLGTGTAWLVTFCRFPGRDMLAVALLFPLAMPTYLLAYAYSDFFDDAGPVFSLWQALLPGLAYPSLHSLGGAVFVMSLVLYPYVFLSTRAAFIQQARGPVEAARSLGHGPASCFWRISLPLARPALIVGVSLALMECLNDIGAVEHLGVRTLTIGVYDTWLVRGNLAGAAQMALVLLGFIALLLALERSHRGAQAYAARAGQPAISAPSSRLALSRLGGMAALLACLLPVLLGFIVPVMLFFDHAARAEIHYGLAAATRNSVFLAMLAALLTCLIGMVMAYAARLHPGRAMTLLSNAASLGYAVPGAVLAIGVMVVLARAEAISGGVLAFGGTLTALLFAYVMRFMPLAFGTIEAGFGRIPNAMDMAARSLGHAPFSVLRHVHIPLLRPAIIVAALMVFVDVMKELPATLILRPFDFETLASSVYSYASLGAMDDAALPALIIIAVGLVPVGFMLRLLDRQSRI